MFCDFDPFFAFPRLWAGGRFISAYLAPDVAPRPGGCAVSRSDRRLSDLMALESHSAP